VTLTTPLSGRFFIGRVALAMCHLYTKTEVSRCSRYEAMNTYTRLTALCPGLPGWAGTRKVKPIWILLKQETGSGSGSGISWAICKSASRSRQITMPAPHHSIVFLRPDALPAAQPTVSKHWRDKLWMAVQNAENGVACSSQGHGQCHHLIQRVRLPIPTLIETMWLMCTVFEI